MASNMRKILYISGTRADYGLIRETLLLLKKQPNLKIELAVTGMHLMPKFGKTIEEIKKDGFKMYKIESVFESDDRESQVKFIGKLILGLLGKIKNIKPDIIFIQGDRPEMLAAATVGLYLGIPVAHSHGGEVTLTVDEPVRHAISKLANIHFVSTKKSADRLIKMGENPWRIFVTGAPGLDAILKGDLFTEKELAKRYNLDLSKQILLVLQHPVTDEMEKSARQMKETMEAIRELKLQAIVIYPSSDPGARKMIKIVENYRKYPLIRIYKNVDHKDYLSLMRIADTFIGNSSSGIIEAPSFGLPTVNIGTRQEGRERACNVIDVDYSKEQIKRAIKKAIYDKKFKRTVKKCKNPYGDGRTGKRIAEILSKVKIDKRLLQKQITY